MQPESGFINPSEKYAEVHVIKNDELAEEAAILQMRNWLVPGPFGKWAVDPSYLGGLPDFQSQQRYLRACREANAELADANISPPLSAALKNVVPLPRPALELVPEYLEELIAHVRAIRTILEPRNEA